MNPKEKPTLSGTRIKTRKRDEKLKEKRDPIGFRDAILAGLGDTKDLEQVSKYLDSIGSKLDYRRYGETLFDILFAGGILAPGGSITTEGDPSKPNSTDKCIFAANNDLASIKAYYDVLFKLIRRYKYLEKAFSEELKKLIMFLKGFTEEERSKLAKIVALCLANGLGDPSCLSLLYDDHLVKEGLSLDFLTELSRTWLSERDLANMASSLKKAGLEGKLPNLLPINKRTQDNFEAHFNAAGLSQIVDYQRVKANSEVKKELQKKLSTMIEDEEPAKEIITMVNEEKEKIKVTDQEVVVMVWNIVMSGVEWNKKEELVAEQALKHLKQYASLLASQATSPKAELTLLLKIQDFCYENMNFLKVFQKIVVLLYKMEVISEDVIQHWYNGGHSSKGQSHFLEQMKPFVEWLKNAEEEDSEEEDD